MQNGNNNMDNKLRQLENQQLPDMSKQDEHWQDMKKILLAGLPSSAPKPGGRIKPWHWITAACLIGGISFLVVKQSHDNKTQPKPIAVIRNDASGIKPNETKITEPEKVVISQTVPGKKADREIAKKFTADYRLKKSSNKTTGIPDIVKVITDTMVIPQSPGPKATLAGFFSQLKKPSQEFVIDNKRDTVIYGNDGTTLLIPANTFNTTEKVTITLTEYYSYQDIITNKLSTCSNGQLLITGGMVHLTATTGGREVDIQPQKSIRWFVPDTLAEMKDMQVFAGQQKNGPSLNLTILNDGDGPVDTSSALMRYNDINWVPQDRFFRETNLNVRVLDLCDEPYRSRETKKGLIGKFHIASDSKLSKEELETEMLKRYGYYKVKVKKMRDKGSFLEMLLPRSIRRTRQKNWASLSSLGDSAWIDKETARRYKLKATDTMITEYAGQQNRMGFVFSSNYKRIKINSSGDTTIMEKRIYDNSAFSDRNLKNLANKFSVDITSLGWINCDRFYNDSREKIPFYVDLKDTASQYYTLLVFDKIKSMMTGMVAGNKVMFLNVPAGETAKVVSVGIKEGKPIAAMEPVKISRTTLTGLKFEETTPAEFKEQSASMDK